LAKASAQAKAPVHLLDVNTVIALLDEAHVHHHSVMKWFDTPGLQWALSPFTEAGLLRFMMQPKMGGMGMEEVSLMLARLRQEPGYHYQAMSADWHTLTKPFSRRLHGHRQVTDAYLLGLAVNEGLTLVTFDRAMLHLAGEHGGRVLVLE
jgi:predicted nucleic acid-binding protein